MTLGEMISLLPIRGAVFMLPYRFLARGVVFNSNSNRSTLTG
jgi:AAT family amino acid transporter